MTDLLAALDAFTVRDPNRRDVAAAVLGDLLRGTALDTDTACLVVGRMVSLAVHEPETKVRESALNSIREACNHHRLPPGPRRTAGDRHADDGTRAPRPRPLRG